MKLSILYESRNPKQPTDLSLVATQSTIDGAKRGKYPVNFYSGKIGKKSNGKVVLGYHDKNEKFRTTGPIVGIVQSKKAPDRWLIKTENNGPYYYSLQMPEATVMATYNRYLKGTTTTPIPIYTYDQNTKKHINKKDAGKRANEGWSFYNGTTIHKRNMPTRKPKTSIEAYDYLMYWAYHNNQLPSAADAISYDQLIEFLSNGKRLSKRIREIVAAFPNAKEAVIKRLEFLKEEQYSLSPDEFELNLDVDEPVTDPEPSVDATKDQSISDEHEADRQLDEFTKGLEKDLAGQAEEAPPQDTSAEESSALDQDTHRGLASDSGSVEMPASNQQQIEAEEASPEVVTRNSRKFTKLLTNLREMDPETAPKRLRKVISEFLELRNEPAHWGKCFVDNQDHDLVYRLEDYDRLCMVKAFWAGDNRKSKERRETEWPKMDQTMKAFVGGLRDTIDSELANSRASLNSALKQLINKIRQIHPSFYTT